MSSRSSSSTGTPPGPPSPHRGSTTYMANAEYPAYGQSVSFIAPDAAANATGPAREDDPLYPVALNAYGSHYGNPPARADDDALASSSSLFVDSRKDSYHPIKLQLSGGGQASFLSPFASASRIASTEEIGTLRSHASAGSSLQTGEWRAGTRARDDGCGGRDVTPPLSPRTEMNSFTRAQPARSPSDSAHHDSADSATLGPPTTQQSEIFTGSHCLLQAVAAGSATAAQETANEEADRTNTSTHEQPPTDNGREPSPESGSVLNAAPPVSEKDSPAHPIPDGTTAEEVTPSPGPSVRFVTPRDLVQSSSSSSSGSAPELPPVVQVSEVAPVADGGVSSPVGSPTFSVHSAPFAAEAPPSWRTSRSSSSSSSSSSTAEKRERPSSVGRAEARTAHTLGAFLPLIQQDNYRKADIKDMASTCDYGCLELVSTSWVTLEAIRPVFLQRYEPAGVVRERMLKAGRMKRPGGPHSRKRKSVRSAEAAAKKCAKEQREITMEDFAASLVGYDNFLMALSLALYGSVLYYDTLVQCALDDLRILAEETPTQSEASSNTPIHDEQVEGTAPVVSSSSSSSSRYYYYYSSSDRTGSRPVSRLRVALPVFLRWLNSYGVDALIMTADRRAASSFCAKRWQVQQRAAADDAADGAIASDVAKDTEAENAPVPPRPPRKTHRHGRRTISGEWAFTDGAPLRRTLVALEYDRRAHVWCPVTLARPIRQTSATTRRLRTAQRRAARKLSREMARKQREETAAKAAADKVAAKWAAWREKQEQWDREAAAADANTSTGDEDGVFGETALSMGIAGNKLEDDVVAGPDSGPDEAPSKLPFYKMQYPNLLQSDCGCGALLGQSMNPRLRWTRLKLILGLPLGVVAFFIGLALIICASKKTDWCVYAEALGRCVTAAMVAASSESSGVDSDSGLSCAALLYHTRFDEPLANRYLFGRPMAVGNCLIVVIVCVFAATIAIVMFVFFATRFLATGSVRPVFFYVVQGALLVLCAITCAFAAYAVYLFHATAHTFHCNAFQQGDRQLCDARLAACGTAYSLRVYENGRRHVTLALAIVLLALCGLLTIVAALPALPPPSVRAKLPVAQPETYAFRPSPYIPDGPSAQQRHDLYRKLQPRMQAQLAQQVKERDRLLTYNVTVGEMMQANKEQSLRRMATTMAKEQRRRGRLRDRGKASAALSGRRSRAIHYAVFPDADTLDDSSSSSGSGSGRQHRRALAAVDNVVLSPAQLSDVWHISRRVRKRRRTARTCEDRMADSATVGSPLVAQLNNDGVACPPVESPCSPVGTVASFDGGRVHSRPASALPPLNRQNSAASLTRQWTSPLIKRPPCSIDTAQSVEKGGIVHSPFSSRSQSPTLKAQRSFRKDVLRSFYKPLTTDSANPLTPFRKERSTRQEDRLVMEKDSTIQSIVERLRTTESAAGNK